MPLYSSYFGQKAFYFIGQSLYLLCFVGVFFVAKILSTLYITLIFIDRTCSNVSGLISNVNAPLIALLKTIEESNLSVILSAIEIESTVQLNCLFSDL